MAFEMREAPSVRGSQFKLMFVQCVSCGAVVGVTDYYNIGNLLHELATKLGVRLSD